MVDDNIRVQLFYIFSKQFKDFPRILIWNKSCAEFELGSRRYYRLHSRYDITAVKPDSVKTGRSMEEIKAQSKGAVEKTGQGQKKRRTSRKKE